MTTELLLRFAEFLTEKVVNESNSVVIAEFLEGFLVPELQKLERASSDELADALGDKPSGDAIEYPSAVSPPEVEAVPRRSGNGHKILKKRDMTGDEKGDIAKFFTLRNGQIDDDACVKWKRGMDEVDAWADVAIFQVVGYVSAMHGRVARGVVELKDMPAYLEFIKSHRNLWATYNSPRYRALRSKIGIVDVAPREVAAETEPKATTATEEPVYDDEPKFAVGFKGGR